MNRAGISRGEREAWRGQGEKEEEEGEWRRERALQDPGGEAKRRKSRE